MRRIAVFSSTRADLWPLRPVVDALLSDVRTDPFLIATGTHLSTSFGRTIDEVHLPPPRIASVDTSLSSTAPVDLAALLGAVSEGVGRILAARRPDAIVLLGDRAELLGAAGAALLAGVPIVHLHGGERTEGAIDDQVRHAISQMASLHCCAAVEHAEHLVSMGIAPETIRVTGAPGIDRLISAAVETDPQDLIDRVGPLRGRIAMLTYHPPTRTPERIDPELDAILTALDACDTVIATFPGADVGSSHIIDRLAAWAETRDGVALVPSLGALFPLALAQCDLMIGNSSSGIIEAPTFATPVINVGDRQRGRTRSACVIDVPGDLSAVEAALERAFDPEFIAAIADEPNPFGDGKSAPRIAEAIATYEFGFAR